MINRQTNLKPPGNTSALAAPWSPPVQTAEAKPAVATVPMDCSLTRRALALAIGSLLLAGCFSLLLIVGRMPVFSAWVSDPLFFKRCLVRHVELALVVWFFSFAAGLY